MTLSFTTSSTFTKTHADYLASKVAADLQQIQAFYDHPSNQRINDYIDELVILLLNGCLKMVEYGFVKGSSWVLVARYSARFETIGATDERPGRIPGNANVAGATWASFLEYNSRWSQISRSERDDIQAILPFQRVGGSEPSLGVGGSDLQRTYSRNGVALDRGVYRTQ